MKKTITNGVTAHLGFRIGHSHDAAIRTGVSVILPDSPATCSVDVRGGGPGTREISALQDGGLIEQVHAIVLAGGSVYGLAAADGVTAWLGSQGIGYDTGREGVPVSPIVPSAILFDNANGGDKNWGQKPPFHHLAIQACDTADYAMIEGKTGAGYGATAGIYQGGLGAASELVNGVTVTAIIAANPIGSPYMPNTQCPWAWAYEQFDKDGVGEFGGVRPPENYQLTEAKDSKLSFLKTAGQSTVIGAVLTDASLNQKQLKRLSMMAQDGIAMAVQPAHTPLDGDTIFALSVGDKPCCDAVFLAELGGAAARVTARALMRGVYHGCAQMPE
ncbi:MAG: P1 family peptidase [Litorimonas sp.]